MIDNETFLGAEPSAPFSDTPSQNPSAPASINKKKPKSKKKKRKKKSRCTPETPGLEIATGANSRLVTIRPSPVHGFGLFALQDIPVGTKLVSEEPVIVFSAEEKEFSAAFLVEGTYEEMARREMGSSLVDRIYTMFLRLQPLERAQVETLLDKHQGEGAYDNKTEPVKEKMKVKRLVDASMIQFSKTEGMIEDVTDDECDDQEISGSIEDDREKNGWKKGKQKKEQLITKTIVTGMLYLMLSRVNHSCCPNAQINLNEQTTWSDLVSVKDIKAGEEIFSADVDPAQPHYARQTLMRTVNKGDWSCNCEACDNKHDHYDRHEENRRKIASYRQEIRDSIGELRSGEEISIPELQDKVQTICRMLKEEGLENTNEMIEA
jgi:hypothetical protein